MAPVQRGEAHRQDEHHEHADQAREAMRTAVAEVRESFRLIGEDTGEDAEE
jgi:hypothetical protein